MSKLPRVSGREVGKALQKAGFEPTRPGRHGTVFSHPDGRRVTVPLHPEIDRGTLQAIINVAKLTREEFLKLLK